MSKDILLNQENDLQFKNGDFVTGPSDEQHIGHILQAQKGDYKQSPLVGAGLPLELNGNIGGEALNKVKIALLMDGYKTKVQATENGIKVTYDNN